MAADVIHRGRLGDVVRATPGGATTIGSLAVAALGAIAFARVAEDYLTNDPLAHWDVSFARWLAEHRTPVGVDAFRVVTFFGSPAVVLAISALVAIVLYRRRRLAEAGLLTLVVGGTELVNVALKLAFHRPRPEVGFVHLDTYSFPSGHAMMATAAYGALAFLAWRRGWRAEIALATVALVCAIGFSRLYLGVHYLSDVLGGVSGGVTCLGLAVALYAAQGLRFAAWFSGSRLDRLGRAVLRS
jgi:membrane-associated phospholipid phosphatase